MQKTFILIDCIGRGGAERIAVTLANELATQGHAVHLLLLRRNIEYAPNEQVTLHVMSNIQFAKRGSWAAVQEIWKGFWWTRRVLNAASGGEPRVLISHLTRSNVINILLGLFPAHKAICVSHNSVGFYRGRGILKLLLLKAQGILLPLAHRTICVSKRMAADYRRICLFHKESIVTVYNPVCLPTASALAPPVGAYGNPVHIAMIGRLHAVKRHDLAVKAMALLKARGKRPYVLHIVGDGPEEERVSQMINRAGVGDCVVMHGWTEDTAAILAQSSLSLLCSDTEGFPNAILESLAHGVPVVATDCVSGPRELLAPDQDPEHELPFRHGFYPARHGVLVKLGDAKALADAIEYQLVHAGLSRQRAACIEFARQFDARLVARHYADLVEAAGLR